MHCTLKGTIAQVWSFLCMVSFHFSGITWSAHVFPGHVYIFLILPLKYSPHIAETTVQKWRESLVSTGNGQEDSKDGRPSKPEEEMSHSQGSFYENRRGFYGSGEISVETSSPETPKEVIRTSPSRRLSASLNDTLRRRGAAPLDSRGDLTIDSPELTRRSSFKVVDSRLEVTDEALSSVFYTFCVYGKRSGPPDLLNGRQFAKMMKDSKITSKKFNNHGVDILFSKVAIKMAGVA
jgi:hypothetical protein